MINCALGLELLRSLNNSEDKIAALIKLKGVDSIDKLTRSEIKELTELSQNFNLAVMTPKDVKDVRLEFMLGGNYITLGKFSELDITLQAVELLEDFNPGEIDRIPMMLGCIYAPVIKGMLELPDSIPYLATEISEAIKDQVEFDDVYAIYDFFVVWKESSTRVPSPSFKHSMKCYQLRRIQQLPTRLITARLLTASPKELSKIMRAIKGLLFIGSILIALMFRWLFTTTASLREWLKKRQTK